MKDRRPNRDTAYDRLVGKYYGGHHVPRHPASARWLARTAEELLSGYYGRPRGSERTMHATPVSVASSLDDGETLRSGGVEPAFEEYVVARSLSDDVFEEYVVERPPAAEALATGVSLTESMPDPRAECQVDVLDPLSGPVARDGLAAPGALPTPQAAAAPTSAAASQAVSPLPARAAGGISDDDFIADMQSILTGQSVYDPVTRKTLAKEQLAAAPAALPPPTPNDSQAIFDKIAANMQYANTYDLGTVELENRFADFDRVWESENQKDIARRAGRAAARRPPPEPASGPSTEDFIQDLDALRRDALDKVELRHAEGDGANRRAPADDYGRVPTGGGALDESAALSMAARAGTAPESALTAEAGLNGAFVTQALQTLFGNAAQINTYFSQLGAPDFISWFNANAAGRGPWANKTVGTTTQTRANFNSIWDRIPQMFGSLQINLLQFLSLMSIFINEVGGDLGPISERVGTSGHPGLAYAFDRIPGKKASYNVDGSNWTAYQCFQQPEFVAAHGQKALGAQLQNTNDQRWAGAVYPPGYPTDPDPAVTGFVMEADFYKFRGRGLIQTTWRGAYLSLIGFVQAYAGTQQAISARTAAWASMTADQAANASSNADWDDLFMHSDLEIPCIAIAQHNAQGGNYLALSGDVNVLNGRDVSGSIWRMGRRISGGQDYADLFRSRVIALCSLLGN